MRFAWAAVAAAITMVGPAAAGEDPPAYMDDRSTPEAVVRSYFNALALRQVSRAMSYATRSAEAPDFEEFRTQVEAVRFGEVRLGETFAEGAVGTIYWQVPVAVEVTVGDGATQVRAGCIFLSHIDPMVQDTLPYEPIGIRNIELDAAGASFDAVQATCPDG